MSNTGTFSNPIFTQKFPKGHIEKLVDQTLNLDGPSNCNTICSDIKNVELMFSSVVHEFRTPINSFVTDISLLKLNFDSLKAIIRKNGLTDEHLKHIWESSAKYFKTCQISSKMMMKLTDDILDLSKINNGVFELNECQFEIRELIEEITYVFESQ
jgi:signal transduction histidine kinase